MSNASIMSDTSQDVEPKLQTLRRPDIKQQATSPQITVCFPIGDKHESVVLSCPEHLGGCGKTFAVPGLRQPNLVPAQLMLAHMNVAQPLNVTMAYLAEGGRLSAEARQVMTRKALSLGTKYVLYWDDDTLPPPMGLYILHNFMETHPEAGAVSGIYTTREDPCEPLVYTQHGAGAAWDIPMGPGSGATPILGAGAGFLLARADAIREVQEELGDVPIWADERAVVVVEGEELPTSKAMWGHDVRFCKLLGEAGWPVYAHGQVLCGHLDIQSGRVFHVPEDAPGMHTQRKKNINTQAYWDKLYGAEGLDTWRTYETMFGAVAEETGHGELVVELGCGMGILAQWLVARKGVRYRGFDISEVAVAACKARFLDAQATDICDMILEDFDDADTVIATELMEHLDEEIFHFVLTLVAASPVKKFVFTVPDNCMGPDEVPEHTALFNEALVRERLAQHPLFKIEKIKKVDEHHLMVVLTKE